MKFGVMVHSLRACQQNYYLIQSLNEMASDSGHDLIVFFEEPAVASAPVKFATMQAIEGYSFDGVLIATNFQLARKLARYPGPAHKIFFVWELEWMLMNGALHRDLRAVYCNPNLKLVTRSQEYAKIIEDVWNLPNKVLVADFLDLPSIVEQLNG